MEFNAGEKVYVKAWEDMVAENVTYIDHRGNICEKGTSYSFTQTMKRYCGSPALITQITENNELYLFFDGFENIGFVFREWMLEPGERKVTVYMVQRSDDE